MSAAMKAVSLVSSALLFLPLLSACSATDINRTAAVLSAVAAGRTAKSDPVKSAQYKKLSDNYVKEVDRQNTEANARRTGKADQCLEFDDPKYGKLPTKNICSFPVFQIVSQRPIGNYDEGAKLYGVYGYGVGQARMIEWESDDKWDYFRGDVCLIKPVKSFSKGVPIKC